MQELEPVNPDDFIITRKRKKYRFAKFSNAENCFELTQWKSQSIDVLEIGAGTGLFSVELASLHPEHTYVALDVKADRLQKGAYEALKRGLTNVFFIRARADTIDQLFDANSLSEIWVTFPDPFPKKRSAGRRLMHPTFLKTYAKLLAGNGALYHKHDNRDFFCWSLEQLISEKWQFDALSFDLHDSEIVGDATILTTFEKRWLGDGRITNFVSARVL